VIFPNPSNGIFFVKCNNSMTFPAETTIYDMPGIEICRQTISGNDTTVQLKKVEKVYFVNI